MDAKDLAAGVAAGRAPVLIDVRSRSEFADGHIAGAVNVPFWRFFVSWPRIPADRDEPIVVYCGRGPRARMAIAVLRGRGYSSLEELDGHMAGWRAAGLPLATASSTSSSRPGR